MTLPHLSPVPQRAADPRFIHARWPRSVRSAERLWGHLVPLGPGLIPRNVRDSPATRRFALAHLLTERVVASHLTAAWIWGMVPAVPLPLRGLRRPTRRRQFGDPREDDPSISVQYSRFYDGEIRYFDAFGVTSTVRTLCDLLRDRSSLDAESSAIRVCGSVMSRDPALRARVAEALAERRHPERALAVERLERAVRLTQRGSSPHDVESDTHAQGTPYTPATRGTPGRTSQAA